MSYGVSVKSVLTRFYLFRGLSLAWLYVPYQWFYLREQGLSATDLMILNTVFCVAAVVLEVPTGALADRLGRRAVLVAGSLVSSLSCLIFLGMPDSFFWLSLANVLAALAMTCVSGADSAYLFELLSHHGRGDGYKRAEAFSSGFKLALGAAGGVGATVLVAGGFELSTLYLVTALLGALAALLALSLGEPWRKARKQSRRTSITEVLRESAAHGARGLGIVLGQRELLALLLLSAALFPVLRVGLLLDQPFVEGLGFSAASLGVIYASKDMVAAIAAGSTAWLLVRFGEMRLLSALPLMACLALGLMAGAEGMMAVVLVLLPTLAFGVFSPLVRVYINRRLDGCMERATVLSFEGMARRFGFALFSPLVGAAIDLWSLGVALALSAGWAALALVLVFILPLRRRSRCVESTTEGSSHSRVRPDLRSHAPDVQPG